MISRLIPCGSELEAHCRRRAECKDLLSERVGIWAAKLTRIGLLFSTLPVAQQFVFTVSAGRKGRVVDGYIVQHAAGRTMYR